MTAYAMSESVAAAFQRAQCHESRLLALEYFDLDTALGASFETPKGSNGKHALMVRVKGRNTDELLAELIGLFRAWEASA